MSKLFEIHRYKGDIFEYVVARTNKHSEEEVRLDTQTMNAILSPAAKEGIRYVLAEGSIESHLKSTSSKGKKAKKEKSSGIQNEAMLRVT